MWDVAGLKLSADAEAFAKADKRLKDFQGTVDDTEGSVHKLARTAGVLAGSLVAAFSVRAIANYADAWSDMQSRVGAAIKDMDAAPELMQRLVRVANASYSPLQQTVETYTRNVAVLRDLGYQAEETADFTESLNHMLVITATRGERAASVQNALSKAMALGKLQAEGLETVLANGGRVAEALAGELGTTVAGLRGLASEGKITGEVIASALLGSLEEVRVQAGEMPATIADGFVRISTGVETFIGRLDQALGASQSFASLLVSIGDGMLYIAEADFGAILESIGYGATVLAQGLLILSATRIPALVSGLMSVNIAGGLMTAQFIAGAAASRLMSVAMGAAATAGRSLMAAVGGIPGLIAMGMATAVVSIYNSRQAYQRLEEATAGAATAQTTLNTALETYSRIKNEETIQNTIDAATLRVENLRAQITETENLLSGLEITATGPLGMLYEAWSAEVETMRANLGELKGELVGAAAILDMAVQSMTAFRDRTAESKNETLALTAEQQKARDTARDMLMDMNRQLELLRLEKEYGKDSNAYRLTALTHERDIYFAKVQALDITNKEKQALRDTWLELQTATGKTEQWDAAMKILKKTTADAVELAKTLGQTEPGASWLDTAIAKAGTLGALLKAAVGDLGRLGSYTALPQTMGDGSWAEGLSGELLLPPAPKADPGDGGGAGGGGASVASEMQSRYDALVKGFQAETALTMEQYAADKEALDWALANKKIAHEAYQDYLGQLHIETWGASWEQEALQYQMEQEALQAALDQKIISHEEYYRRLKELQFANLLAETNRSDMAEDLSNTSKYFGQLYSMTGSSFDGLLKLQQGFSAASALISAWEGYAKALTDGGMTPWMRLMWAGKILAAGMGAVRAIKGGGKGGSSASGGSGAGTTTVTQKEAEAPLKLSLDTFDPSQLYTGAAIQAMFERFQEEAGNRGIVWTTAGEN